MIKLHEEIQQYNSVWTQFPHLVSQGGSSKSVVDMPVVLWIAGWNEKLES